MPQAPVIRHELGAEVVEVQANDRGISAGAHCTVEPYLNGGMREFLAVPLDHIHTSSRLTFDQLVLVEPLSIGAHAVMRSGLAAGDHVLVIGAGPIGTAVTQLASAAGARVRVIETTPYRRALVERLGVEALVEADDRLADVVIDATGNIASMAQSFSRARFGGRIVWVG
jgi:threonine dehydrogenase-like Zn-dependent dehydrogenase